MIDLTREFVPGIYCTVLVERSLDLFLDRAGRQRRRGALRSRCRAPCVSPALRSSRQQVTLSTLPSPLRLRPLNTAACEQGVVPRLHLRRSRFAGGSSVVLRKCAAVRCEWKVPGRSPIGEVDGDGVVDSLRAVVDSINRGVSWLAIYGSEQSILNCLLRAAGCGTTLHAWTAGLKGGDDGCKCGRNRTWSVVSWTTRAPRKAKYFEYSATEAQRAAVGEARRPPRASTTATDCTGKGVVLRHV